MYLRITFCNHQRPVRAKLLKSLYPSVLHPALLPASCSFFCPVSVPYILSSLLSRYLCPVPFPILLTFLPYVMSCYCILTYSSPVFCVLAPVLLSVSPSIMSCYFYPVLPPVLFPVSCIPFCHVTCILSIFFTCILSSLLVCYLYLVSLQSCYLYPVLPAVQLEGEEAAGCEDLLPHHPLTDQHCARGTRQFNFRTFT